MENNDRLWELLGKKTSGESTESEEKELSDLLGEKDGNIRYMMSVLDHYWEAVQGVEEIQDAQHVSHENSRHAFRGIAVNRMNIPFLRFNLNRRKPLLWAAMIAVLIMGGWLSWHTFKAPANEMNVVSTRSGSKTKITLPDGTQVWLNADSKLSYPNDFQHVAMREITLTGEAYFEVVHDVNRPFIIHTKYLDIKDIGTAFNVKAYPDENRCEASLMSGSIEVSLRNNPEKRMVLDSKEKVVYYALEDNFSLSGDEIASRKVKPLVNVSSSPVIKVTPLHHIVSPAGDSIVTETAWMNNQLVFQGEKFKELARRMGRWYNVTFDIKSKTVADYSFTGIFEGETVEQALRELQMIRPFQYSISKEKILITDN